MSLHGSHPFGLRFFIQSFARCLKPYSSARQYVRYMLGYLRATVNDVVEIMLVEPTCLHVFEHQDILDKTD